MKLTAFVLLSLLGYTSLATDSVSITRGSCCDQTCSCRGKSDIGDTLADRVLAKPWAGVLAHPEVDPFQRGAGIRYAESHAPIELDQTPFSESSRLIPLDASQDRAILASDRTPPALRSYSARVEGARYDILRGTFAEVGGGLEYRFADHRRGFVEASRVLRDEQRYADQIRFGLRYAF